MTDRGFLMLQNDPQVPGGRYLALLAQAGIAVRVVRPYAGDEVPPLSRCTAAIVLGGAMGAGETDLHPSLETVKREVAEAVAGGTPLLGICLGGQILAAAAGGSVVSGSCGERGMAAVTLTPEGGDDPLFAGMASPFLTFQWHYDTFHPPSQATLLATSDACPRQAFRVGRCAYGLQFHPEIDAAIVASWSAGDPLRAKLAEEFHRFRVSYFDASQRILANFIRIASAAPP